MGVGGAPVGGGMGFWIATSGIRPAGAHYAWSRVTADSEVGFGIACLIRPVCL